MSGPLIVRLRHLALAVVALATLAACNMPGPPVAGVPGLQWEIQRFYLDRATEAGGMCTAPRILSVTRATVLEETDTEVVMRVRYYWRDEGMRPDFDRLPLVSAISCEGFGERDFTFARLAEGALQATAMTGELRNVRQNFGTREGGS